MKTIGADPEILLLDQNGEYVSVEGLVGGTKEKPVPIPGWERHFRKGYAVQEDNVMLEFNVAPADDPYTFSESIAITVDHIQAGILDPLNYTMSQDCSAEYSAVQLSTAQAGMFGCSPDLDAYSDSAASVVSPDDIGRNRFAGGHIHLGYKNPADVPIYVIAQLCDAYLGLREVISGTSQGLRRKYYGTAGRYRQKSYGIEYRTLSNWWLFDENARIEIFTSGLWLAEAIDQGNVKMLSTLHAEIPRDEVRLAINNEDVPSAHTLHKYLDEIRQSAGG